MCHQKISFNVKRNCLDRGEVMELSEGNLELQE